VDESWLVRSGLTEPRGPLPGWYSNPVPDQVGKERSSVAPGTAVAGAIQLMKKKQVEQLPVVDAEG